MAVTTNKKVLVSRFDREPVQGFVQSPETQQDVLEVLRADGSLLKIPVSETKAICFVRDFEDGETWKKHRQFSARPKTCGLWVRLKFRDGDWLEGIVPNNLLHLESAGFGHRATRPDLSESTHLGARPALEGVEVLGVIGSPLRRRKPEEKVDERSASDV